MWRAEKRDKASLVLEWKETYGLDASQAVSGVVDSTGLYVVGTTQIDGGGTENQGWEIRKINLADGSEAWVQTLTTQENYKVRDICVEGDYIYNVGYEYQSLPQLGNLMAWYKVDEGSGSILINSAPSSVDKLPDVNIVVPGASFWTNNVGFGYWDGSTTSVASSWAAMFPFHTKAGTIIMFSKEAYGLNDGTTHQRFIITPYLFAHNVYRVGAFGLQFNFGIGSPAADNYQLKVPIESYYARPFVTAYTHDTVQTQIQKIKYKSAGWVSDLAVQPSGWNGVAGVTGVYIGQYLSGTEKWKGILGDMLIWNVKLTDPEIDQVISLLGPRWGI